MIASSSRYAKTKIDRVTLSDGREVSALRPPVPQGGRLLGSHVRKEGDRLDHLAARYLQDASGFWRLCDANGAVSPEALAAREQIAIPSKES